MDAVVSGIMADLVRAGTPERASAEKRYLKSELAFLGATMPQIQRAVRSGIGGRPLSHEDAIEIALQLWRAPVHERRMAAVLVLERSAGALSVDDLPVLERLVRESRTWALVDGLATSVVGRIAGSDAGRAAPILDRWALDPDFWVRRGSLLAELRPIRDGASLDRFVARADSMLGEREFFIRKAIGWVLREAGKRRPAEVTAWLAPRTHRASGVTMREAVKYLPPGDAERLMTAYREKRPAAATGT
jgi:3-methyladenine DNA glycosylase AlkD